MATLLRLTFVAALMSLLVSCATAPAPVAQNGAKPSTVQRVRTTAYTHNEGTGGRNAMGRRLASAGIKSAASDWSRFPVGTHFRVLGTKDEYMIDDYGGALIGTNTIDLYQPTKLEMHRWGVRHVDIQVLHWGSEAESLRILRPRKNTKLARRMIASIENKRTL